jgi:pathogenicity locus Cdd1 protein
LSRRLQNAGLRDLVAIGLAMLRDLELLGIRSVAALAKQDPERMYEKLGRVVQQRQDICVLDVFYAAVAQARNPQLAAERRQWWWSEERKKRSKSVKEIKRKGQGKEEEKG